MATTDLQHQQLSDAWTIVADNINRPYVRVDVRDDSIISRTPRNIWVWIFAALGQDGPIPYTRFGSPEWMDYLYTVSIPSVLLLLVGGFICLTLTINLWCCRPKATGQMPSLGHLQCTACIGFLGLWFAAFMCIGRGGYTFDLMERSVSRLQPEIELVAHKIEKMNPGFLNAAIWMSSWQKSCLGWKLMQPHLSQHILELNDKMASTLNNISATMYSLDKELRDVPALVKRYKREIKEFHAKHMTLIRCAALSPTLLASVVVLFIVITVSCEARRGSHAARVTNFIVLDLGAIPIAVVIALMTILSAAVLLTGVTVGGYCRHVDSNTINIVSATQEGTRTSDMTGFAQYYLTGYPQNNSIVQSLKMVQNVVKPLSQNTMIINPALDLLGLWCKRVGKAQLARLVDEAMTDIDLVLPLVKRSYLYSYYDEIVVRGICGQFVGSLGWFMTCQIMAGMVLLPVIAVQSHRYLLEAADAEEVEEESTLDVEPAQAEEGTAEESERLLGPGYGLLGPPSCWTACGRRNKVQATEAIDEES